MAGKPQPLKKRFWSKVKKTSHCWIWTAHRNNKGYGLFGMNKTMRSAHRVSYEFLIGEIPEKMCVLHRCDNPPCVNPRHLFLGTVAENNADMIKKGRARKVRGEKHPASKMTDLKVRQARAMYLTGRFTMRSLSEKFGISHTPMILIINRITW